MIKMLLAEVATRLNFFPNKHGIPNFSPRALLKQPKVDYAKHCAFTFGSYVSAPHEDTKKYNTMVPQSLDCIYLRPNYSSHGGHEFLHLATGELITRHGRVKELNISQSVIDRVHELAHEDNIKEFKIQSKWLPTHLAEVDIPENASEEEEDATDKSEDDSTYESESSSEDDDLDYDSEDSEDIDEDIADVTGKSTGKVDTREYIPPQPEIQEEEQAPVV